MHSWFLQCDAIRSDKYWNSEKIPSLPELPVFDILIPFETSSGRHGCKSYAAVNVCKIIYYSNTAYLQKTQAILFKKKKKYIYTGSKFSSPLYNRLSLLQGL